MAGPVTTGTPRTGQQPGVPPSDGTDENPVAGVVQQQGKNGVKKPGQHAQAPLPEGTPLPDGQAPKGFVKDKNGKFVPAGPSTAGGATQADQATGGSRVATKPLFQDDGIDAGAPAIGDQQSPLAQDPTLPQEDGVPTGDTQGDFKAFVGFLDEGLDQLKQPGVFAALLARTAELNANPDQSALQPILDSDTGAAIGKSITDNLEESANQIRDGLPEELRAQWDELVAAVTESPIGKDPKMIGAFFEACADLLITMCARMNDQAARQLKAFFANILSVMSKFDKAKQNEINAYQGQIATKLESGERAQKAAEEQKVWNCLLAIGLIIVAIVCLVLSIFTFGAATAGTVAAVLAAIAVIAAVVMTVCVIIQNLPAILDACGADDAAAAMRKALAGPFGKVLLGIMIVAAVCMLVCGIGGAISAASAGAAAGGGAVNAGATGGSVAGGAGGSVAGGAGGAVGSSVATGAGGAVGSSVATGAGGAVGSSVATGAGGAVGSSVATGAGGAVGSSVATGAGGAVGSSVATGAGAGAGGAVSAGETGMTTAQAVQLGNACTAVAGGGISVARGCIQMSQAQVELATAMIHADIQELQVNMSRLKNELDLNKLYKGDWEESIKGAEEFLNKIFQQATAALGSQAEANAAVASVYR